MRSINEMSYQELTEVCKLKKINYVGKSKETIRILLRTFDSDINYAIKLKNGTKLNSVFIRDYPYKNGITYLYVKAENGKKYLINPKKAEKI